MHDLWVAVLDNYVPQFNVKIATCISFRGSVNMTLFTHTTMEHTVILTIGCHHHLWIKLDQFNVCLNNSPSLVIGLEFRVTLPSTQTQEIIEPVVMLKIQINVITGISFGVQLTCRFSIFRSFEIDQGCSYLYIFIVSFQSCFNLIKTKKCSKKVWL